MVNAIDEYARRPLRYRHGDGIWEMGFGFLVLGISAFQMIHATSPEPSVWHLKGTFAIGIIAIWLLAVYGQRVLRERITYPRTGFVKYRGLTGRPWLAGTLAAAAAGPATILYARLLRRSSASMIVAVAVASCAFLYAFGSRMGAAWRWIALVVMVGGPVAISTLQADHAWEQALSIGFLGLTYFVSGLIAFSLYLRRTRPPEQEAE